MRVKTLIYAFALVSTVSLVTHPSKAEASDRFFCGSSNNEPTIMIQSPQGAKPLIQFKTTEFGSWTPQARCKEVSKKLNLAYDRHHDFLTVGRKNRQQIVCSAKIANGVCQDQIITVPLGENANSYLSTLMDRYYGKASQVLISRPSIYAEYKGLPYWNLKEIVRYWEAVQ